MANMRPYMPTAKTKKRISLSTGSGATAVKLCDVGGEVQIRIRSLSTNTVDGYLAFGNSSVTCDPTKDEGFSPGGTEVFSQIAQGDGLYVAGATESGTATIEIGIGTGW